MTRGTRVVIALVVVVVLAAAGAAGWLVATRPYHRAAATTAAVVRCQPGGYAPRCQRGHAGEPCVIPGFRWRGRIKFISGEFGGRKFRSCAPALSTTGPQSVACTFADGCPGGHIGEQCTQDGATGTVRMQTGSLWCDTGLPTGLSPPSAGVTATCKVGYETVTGGAALGVFIPGQVPGRYFGTQGTPDAATAYQMTITNSTSQTIDVTGFAAVFYSAGTETGSDAERGFQDNFITAGQALTWTVLATSTVNGYGDGSNGYTLTGRRTQRKASTNPGMEDTMSGTG
jgi:hypothetical protein